MPETVRVLAFCGSLRPKSFNRMALAAAKGVAPAGMVFDDADIGALPLYHEDVWQSGGSPEATAQRALAARADALLFATPEYNFSIPGVLKNAIDWLSRPPNSPIYGKPAALFGASGGPVGTARAQYHLRQIGGGQDWKMVNKPEVFIGMAATKFDAAGTLTDETARKLLADLMQNLYAWTLKLRG